MREGMQVMASIRERNGRYLVTWRENGKQRGVTVGSMREAKQAKARAEAGIPASKQTEVRPVSRAGRITVAGYADTFLAEHSYSDHGLRFAKLALSKYILPRFGSQAMNAVTTSDVRKWYRELERSKSGAMIRKIRSVASSMWDDATEAELVESNPWRGHKIKQHVAKAKGIMTPEEYKLILDCISQEYRLLIRTLGETGLRWSEAMRLQRGDIIGQTLHVRKSKSGKPRSFKISADLADALRTALPFVNSVGKPIDYATFRRWHWVPCAEGTGYTPHDLRHAHASWLLGNGADLVTVRDRLGHSSIAITSKYLHSLPDAGDKALCALDAALAA
jgi:integrase